MAVGGGLQDADGQGCPRPLAKAQAQTEKRDLAKGRQQAGMGGLGADMGGKAVVKSRGVRLVQDGSGGTGDEAVQQDRDTVVSGGQHGACHGGNFATTKAAQHLQRIAGAMARHARGNGSGLAGKTGIIDARAAPDPVSRIAAKKRAGDGGGRGRVADAHLARDQQVSGGVNGGPAAEEGCQQIGFATSRGRW